MTQYKFYKTKEGTKYTEAVKEHFTMLPKWNEVYGALSILLGEKITKLAFSTRFLVIDRNELKNEENRKMFKLDGMLKSNTKKAKKLFEDYQQILKDLGLDAFSELRDLDFTYGIMRRRGQDMDRFKTSENDIYFRTDFDLAKASNGMVEEITEREYAEKYLEETKKREETQ